MLLIDTNVLSTALIVTGLIILIMIILQRRYHFPPILFYVVILCALPLSFGINTFVKIPLLNFLGFQAKATNNTLTFLDSIIWVLIVGFTEEGIKFLLFILILYFIKSQKEKQSTIIAYCVGIGFGIGELWYLGWPYIFPSSNALFGVGILSWLSGFGLERFLTTFTHATMFILILYGYRKNTLTLILTLGLAMVIHALVDLPILLSAIGMISPLELSMIVYLELICTFVASFYLLDYFSRTPLDNDRENKKQQLLKRAHDSP